MPDPRDDIISALREVQDLVAATSPPDSVLEEAADFLRRAAASLRPWPSREGAIVVGDWSGDTWRSNALMPEVVLDETSDHSVTGRVRFSPFHHGGGGAVHGGVIPMVFDQVLGRMTNAPGRGRTRTAYLRVNYRKVTPIGPELQVEGTIERVEGRKIFVGRTAVPGRRAPGGRRSSVRRPPSGSGLRWLVTDPPTDPDLARQPGSTAPHLGLEQPSHMGPTYGRVVSPCWAVVDVASRASLPGRTVRGNPPDQWGRRAR